jgi:hypothetical protein
MKKYLTMVLTDKDEAFDMVTKVDHIAFPVKHVMKKPKLSLWEMYKLKKLLELGYEKLEENAPETKQETNGKETIEGEIQKIQSCV